MKTNIADQKSRVGSQAAHRDRRGEKYGTHLVPPALKYVEFVRPETIDRERTTRNFLRNIRQRGAVEAREMIAAAGRTVRRRVDRKKNRLRMGCRAAEAVIVIAREQAARDRNIASRSAAAHPWID